MKLLKRSITLKEDSYGKLQKRADKLGITIVGLIRMIISEYFDKLEG